MKKLENIWEWIRPFFVGYGIVYFLKDIYELLIK
jgi:hypothetical protein